MSERFLNPFEMTPEQLPQIEELKKRLPAHSVPPAMFQELDDLEVALAKEKERKHA
ncbi:MAG: hypothetical protein MAG431_01976 [Chloroflexi bacterium]|nr:hypothetical protein [Chloroflexota bacterium]